MPGIERKREPSGTGESWRDFTRREGGTQYLYWAPRLLSHANPSISGQRPSEFLPD